MTDRDRLLRPHKPRRHTRYEERAGDVDIHEVIELIDVNVGNLFRVLNANLMVYKIIVSR
jgi:hypothetical protein